MAVLDWGLPVIEWLQGLGRFLLAPMQFFSFLGTQWIYLLVMPVILWSVDVGFGIRLGVLVLTSGMLNGSAKLLLGFPRPFWVSGKIAALASEGTYGAPSGHAQNAVALWGRLATAARSRMGTAALTALILLISLSRLYLGVHYPTDVLFGLLIGALLLLLFVALDRTVVDWLRRQSNLIRVLLGLAYPTLLLAFGLLSVSIASSRPLPADWIANAGSASVQIDPRAPDDILAAGGGLLGFSLGAALLVNWGGFRGGGTLQQRSLRYLVGVVGVVVTFFGLQAIFPQDHTVLGNVLRLVRYAATAFWASYLAPRVFAALQLDA